MFHFGQTPKHLLSPAGIKKLHRSYACPKQLPIKIADKDRHQALYLLYDFQRPEFHPPRTQTPHRCALTYRKAQPKSTLPVTCCPNSVLAPHLLPKNGKRCALSGPKNNRLNQFHLYQIICLPVNKKKTFLRKLADLLHHTARIAARPVYGAFPGSCYIRRHNFVGNDKLSQLTVNKRLMSLGA